MRTNKKQLAAATRAFDALHEMGFDAVHLRMGHHTYGRFKTLTLATLQDAAYQSKLSGSVLLELVQVRKVPPVDVQVDAHEVDHNASSNDNKEGVAE